MVERPSGRKWDELRNIKIKVGVVERADGSCYIEWGKNKILVSVYGPKPVLMKHEEDPYEAIVKVHYEMATFSSAEKRGKPGQNRRAKEISKIIKNVFENVIFLKEFPKTVIEIYITVLQSDGGTRTASVVGAALALIDAGIPVKGIVGAVAVGRYNNEEVIDLDKIEDNEGDVDMPMAVLNDEILLLQMEGKLTKEEFMKYLKDGVNTINSKIYPLQRKALDEYLEINKELR